MKINKIYAVLIAAFVLGTNFSYAQIEQIRLGIDQQITGMNGTIRDEARIVELIEEDYLVPIEWEQKTKILKNMKVQGYTLGYTVEELNEGSIDMYATKNEELYFFFKQARDYNRYATWSLEEPHNLEEKRKYILDFIATEGKKINHINDVKKFCRYVAMFKSHDVWKVPTIFSIEESSPHIQSKDATVERNGGYVMVGYIKVGKFIFEVVKKDLGRPYGITYTEVKKARDYKFPNELVFDGDKKPEYIKTLENVMDDHEYFELSIDKGNLCGQFRSSCDQGYGNKNAAPASFEDIELSLHQFAGMRSTADECPGYGSQECKTMKAGKKEFLLYDTRPERYDWRVGSNDVINISAKVEYSREQILKDLHDVASSKEHSKDNENVLKKIMYCFSFRHVEPAHMKLPDEIGNQASHLEGKYVVKCSHGNYILDVKTVYDYAAPKGFDEAINSYKELRYTTVKYVKSKHN